MGIGRLAQPPRRSPPPMPYLWQNVNRRKRRSAVGAGAAARLMSITTRLLFQPSIQSKGPAIMGGADSSNPVTFARVPDGNIYMANGLMPVTKWDGIAFSGAPVGVSPPATALTVAGSGSGTITGVYTAYQRFVDGAGHVSNLSPVSNEINVTAAGTITYSAVEIPTDLAKVRFRQIIRNLAGEAGTYYVDVETSDLAATTFSSTRTDTDLGNQEPVPLFDADGNTLANRFAVPPNDKPLLASYLDRMFGAGEVAYTTGNAQVTYGSPTVVGIGTLWNATLAGRFFYPTGTGKVYQIDTVNKIAQTLTLTENYVNSTDPFCVYAIRPPPANRRTVNFSEAGLYEAWPESNGLTIEENGDDITGLMVADSFLFILQRRHIYRLTYRTSPLTDGGLFISAHRGCVNNRCWVYFEGFAYLLDEQGIYKFSGGGQTEPISPPVQDIFWLDHPQGELHVNWNAQKFFHALHNKDEGSIRWFVAMSGSRLPRHALCYNYLANSWWVEEYSTPVGHSCLTDGTIARPLVAGSSRRIYAQGIGTLDGPDPAAGTNRSLLTAASPTSFADTLASYASSGLIGSPVQIVSGRGKGQRNIVAALSGHLVSMLLPWTVQPDTTSVYQLGGFLWKWRSGWYRWINEEGDEQRRIAILFQPSLTAAQMDVRVFKDHGLDPVPWAFTKSSDGVATTDQDPNAAVDLTTRTGFAQIRMSGRRERYVKKADLIALEFEGVNAASVVAIVGTDLEGAVP